RKNLTAEKFMLQELIRERRSYRERTWIIPTAWLGAIALVMQALNKVLSSPILLPTAKCIVGTILIVLAAAISFVLKLVACKLRMAEAALIQDIKDFYGSKEQYQEPKPESLQEILVRLITRTSRQERIIYNTITGAKKPIIAAGIVFNIIMWIVIALLICSIFFLWSGKGVNLAPL
ncbi:unnamed protein product, partial [marine sediment metagenome]